MVEIKEQYSLKKHNTFRLDVKARYFTTVHSVEDTQEIIKTAQFTQGPVLIVGDGANILFTKNYPGLVIHNALKGISLLDQTADNVLLEVAGGEDWHQLVTYSVDHGWTGIENLAFIPGTVGAAPVQNIAAYGQSLEETFVSLEAVSLETGEIETFAKESCKFRYRHSVFKDELKGKYFITKVTLQLSTEFHGVDSSYHSRYESLQGELESFAKKPYTLKDIFEAVVRIRKKKLPEVSQIGTVGSTFANPIISREKLTELQQTMPNLQYYPVDRMQYPPLDDPTLQHAEIVKIPAGWLLEELGWKGKRVGNVGVFPNHALCVVAYEGATASEVYRFTETIREDFQRAYGIKLEYEVNVI